MSARRRRTGKSDKRDDRSRNIKHPQIALWYGLNLDMISEKVHWSLSVSGRRAYSYNVVDHVDMIQYGVPSAAPCV